MLIFIFIRFIIIKALNIATSKDAKSILATQAIEQLSSATGLSAKWAVNNDVHKLLDCSESKAVSKLLKMLDSSFGVSSDLITSQQKRVDGKPTRFYKVDTAKLHDTALSTQALALVANNADYLTQRLDKISGNTGV